jgi:predicted metal-dependent hydrolase
MKKYRQKLKEEELPLNLTDYLTVEKKRSGSAKTDIIATYENDRFKRFLVSFYDKKYKEVLEKMGFFDRSLSKKEMQQAVGSFDKNREIQKEYKLDMAPFDYNMYKD